MFWLAEAPIRRLQNRSALRSTFMDIKAHPAANEHDIRLVLILGIANWFIFLDHIPDNVMNRITIRNYGFSGAADLFVFILGYSAAMVYAKMVLDRGFIVGATRIFKRVWQLYAAYIVLFIGYIVTIGDVATQYAAPDLIYEFNVTSLIDHPIRTIGHGLILQTSVLNLDMLQLYIVLMACFVPVLWMMMRKPGLTMAGSVALYLAARHFEWSVPSFPDGDWHFNPFCWQLLFMLGAWVALTGAKRARAILESPAFFWFGIAYLVFAFVMTMAGDFPEFAKLFPQWLFNAFNPNDRPNLAPYRILHFIVLANFVTRWVPANWRGLQWPVFRPLIICGQQSLAVFCVGVFLSFAAHLALITSSGSLMEQVVVSVTGLALMTLVAYYITWSRQQDEPLRVASAEARRPDRARKSSVETAPDALASGDRRVLPSI
jgi:hypothetical protein